MHMVLGVVLHTTVLAIVGYLLLFTASKAEGLVALIGRLLGLWVFLLAILSVVAVVTAPMFGGKLFGIEMMHDHGPGGWMHHMGPPPGPPPPPPAQAAPPAPPAKP